MRQLLRAAMIAVTIATFVGCGKNAEQSGSSGDSSSPDNRIQTESADQAKSVAKAATVTCAGESCHPSVGMLSMVLPPDTDGLYGAGSCTAFVVSSDVIATNAHCVPTDLRNPGASCRDRIWINFPSMPAHDADQIECAQVLAVSRIADRRSDPDYLRLPDYAFLRLAGPAHRPALAFKFDGLADNQQITIVKVDPISSLAAVGQMVKSTCTAVQGSVILPSFNDAQRPIATLSGCGTIEGNSGSPIIDANGNVRALLYAGKPADDYPEVSFATNAACLPTTDGSSAHPLPNSCAVTPNSDAGHGIQPSIAKPTLDKVAAALDTAANDWGRLADERVEWTAFDVNANTDLAKELARWNVADAAAPSDVYGRVMYGKPQSFLLTAGQVKCFKDPSKWLSKYKHFLGGYDASATIEVDSPIWEAAYGMDAEYRLTAGIRQTIHTLHIEIRFSPSDLNGKGKSQATITARDWRYGTHVIGSAVVDTCK